MPCKHTQLFTLETTTARIRENSLIILQHLSPTVSTALHAIAKGFLKDICNTLFSSELHEKAAKAENVGNTRVEEQRNGPRTRLRECKVQEKGQDGSHFRTTCSEEKSVSDFKSVFTSLFVPQGVRTDSAVSSSAFLSMSLVALEQVPKSYLRIRD